MINLELTEYQAANLQRYLSHLSFGAGERLHLDMVAGQLSRKTKIDVGDIKLIPFQILYHDIEEGVMSEFPTFHLP